MFLSFQNQKGITLPYVLMMMLVLMVFVPVLLTMTSTTQLTGLKRENEKKATSLAVSGMQTFINFAGTKEQQKNYLATNSGRFPIQTPEGENIDYYQYAVAYGSSNTDFSNQLSSGTLTDVNTMQYRAVIKSIAGDINSNRVKDTDEKFYYEKSLVYDINYTPGAISNDPVIDPVLKAGMTQVKGFSTAGAIIKIKDQYGNIYQATADASGAFTVDINRSLVQDEVLTVTATELDKAESKPINVTVLASSTASDNGYVIIIEPDGDRTYQAFQPEIIAGQDILVTDEIYVTNKIGPNGDGTYTTTNGEDIILIAGSTLTIEDGVELSNVSGGGSAGVDLQSLSGDVIISGADFTSSHDSSFSNINIESKGNVYLMDTTLKADRDVTIKAGGNIYAKNAKILVNHNQSVVSLTLTAPTNLSKIDVTGLTIADWSGGTREGSATPLTKVCGNLAKGSITDYTPRTCN